MRRTHPLMALAVIAILPALVLGGIWQLAERRAARGEPPEAIELPTATPTTTRVLSVRRAPGTLAVGAALPALAFQLEPVVLNVDQQSCLLVSVAGRTVTDIAADRSLLPASNVKLVTGAVALDVIGPDFRYVTELRGRVVDGVVQGNLYFVGGGDPLLAVESYPETQRYPPEPRTPLESLVEQLVDAGVTAIEGGVVGVETRYDSERFPDTWGEGVRVTEGGPLGALLVNDGFVSGNPVKPDEPAIAATIELMSLMAAEGITAGAFPSIGPVAPDATVLATVESAPFREVLAQMLTTSDNNSAELILKEIAVQSNRPGTRADGLAVVNQRLTEWDIPLAGVTLVDGSGLDRGNRLTCRTLHALLGHVDLEGVFGRALPVAGQPGTLSEFFQETPLDGNLRAKTGTLTGAKAFSGFLPSTGGVELVFSLLINGEATASCGNTSCPLFESLGRALATYPGGAPDAATLSPQR